MWQGIIGIGVLTGVAWAFSENRGRVSWKVPAVGLALQFAIAVLFLKVGMFTTVFIRLNDAVTAVQNATKAGTSFVFGYLGGGTLPFAESHPGASFILAFQALPLILVVSALSAVLFHWRVLPAVVRGFAWLLQRSLRVGGAGGFAVAANIFVGMLEAPLLVRPYLKNLSRADLFMVMTAGMATVAGTVLVLYASFLANTIHDTMAHILIASMICAPAAITLARVMVPPEEDEIEANGEDGEVSFESGHGGTMDALTRGTMDGVALLINVTAMLIVMVAVVSLINAGLGLLPEFAGAPLKLERIFGWLMTPVAWLIGIPWEQAAAAGQLLGVKVILNELIAYLGLAGAAPEVFDPRTRLILVYALCGFANFGSLGIMIGGLVSMAPDRRDDIIQLAPRTILSGMLTTLMTGAVIGLLF